MRRREVLILGSTAIALPFAAGAQQRAMPVIGVLFGGSAAFFNKAATLPTFLAGLGELGYHDGQNVAIEYRFAEGRYERLPTLAAELAALKVDVIVGLASPASLASKSTSPTIPVVFSVPAEP